MVIILHGSACTEPGPGQIRATLLSATGKQDNQIMLDRVNTVQLCHSVTLDNGGMKTVSSLYLFSATVVSTFLILRLKLFDGNFLTTVTVT